MAGEKRGGRPENLISRSREYAHYALAAIRFFNGAAALLFPRQLARRLDVDVDESPGILYFQRMFGIRTMLIARDLVAGDAEQTMQALRVGRVIHGSDAASAALAAASGNLGCRAAIMATAISLVNLALALLATPRGPRRRRLNPFAR